MHYSTKFEVYNRTMITLRETIFLLTLLVNGTMYILKRDICGHVVWCGKNFDDELAPLVVLSINPAVWMQPISHGQPLILIATEQFGKRYNVSTSRGSFQVH